MLLLLLFGLIFVFVPLAANFFRLRQILCLFANTPVIRIFFSDRFKSAHFGGQNVFTAKTKQQHADFKSRYKSSKIIQFYFIIGRSLLLLTTILFYLLMLIYTLYIFLVYIQTVQWYLQSVQYGVPNVTLLNILRNLSPENLTEIHINSFHDFLNNFDNL